MPVTRVQRCGSLRAIETSSHVGRVGGNGRLRHRAAHCSGVWTGVGAGSVVLVVGTSMHWPRVAPGGMRHSCGLAPPAGAAKQQSAVTLQDSRWFAQWASDVLVVGRGAVVVGVCVDEVGGTDPGGVVVVVTVMVT